MYGLVNKAVEELVVTNFGEEQWERIKVKAGVTEEVFISNESYPDEMTYQLVGAASEVLGIPAEGILEAFGEHWVLNTAMKGYGAMMTSCGSSLPEFLINLPNFHTRVAMIYPNLQPPRFSCSDIGENSLQLHYFSHRQGLKHFVIGLVKGLGKLYKTPCQCECLTSCDNGADHDIFLVSW